MTTQNKGPLSIAVGTSETVTAVPLITEGTTCKWKLANVVQKTSEKGDILMFEWHLVDPAPTTEGRTLNPGEFGATFFENIALFDKNTPPGDVPQWARKRIAQRQDALLGTGDPNNSKGKPTRPDFDAACLEQMIGKELYATMKVKTGAFTGNEFDTLYFPGDVQK